MKIVNNRIESATEKELYRYWLDRGLDDLWTFGEYVQCMIGHGVTILAVQETESESDIT